MTAAERRWAFLGGMVAGALIGPPVFYLFFLHVPRVLTPH